MIFDNKKKNRIISFSSPTGLQALSESEHWNGDGTFYSASKFFRQTWNMHAFFPAKKGLNSFTLFVLYDYKFIRSY